MSGRFFKRRRQSSQSINATNARDDPRRPSFAAQDEALSVVAANDEHESDSSRAHPASRSARTSSVSNGAGISSSYSLPSRSYIHHASHGSHEPLQYSSSGVREQTVVLSSSYFGEAEVAEQFNVQAPDTIEEASEPVTPSAESSLKDPPQPHQLSAAMRRHPHRIEQRYPSSSSQLPSEVIVTDDDDEMEPTERSSLLPRTRLSSRPRQSYDAAPVVEGQSATQEGIWNRIGHQYPSLRQSRSRIRRLINPKTWDAREIGRKVIYEPVTMLPAVFLGLLLNLLDALSYGIILFPLGEEVFADLGPDGVSMFYVSCIIAQLVYSSGSIFRGGVGSEMIEVVPFFHKMTYMIIGQMGVDNPDALRATVITSYAMSSIITGLVFFALGSARLGTLVNFFPHSILTGCIGGVGIFLFITGLEVSARLDSSLEPSLDVVKQLFQADTVVLWLPPLVLAILLLTIKHFYNRPWLVPAYYIGITAMFYIITTAVPSITMENLRSNGWVFQAPAEGVPFYNFYTYYKFSLVDWGAIWMTVPSQLALTFFGILHVPINVPNLAMVVHEDNVSINRELIMHGISNTLSGCVGSIQNYLVFVNSVLFMNTGGNSRLAGYMLAAATFGLWVAGPVVIGYVPVMVVGTLIYMLGIDLALEALVATYGRLHRLEYLTIVIIAFVMGVYDFVVGIAIGIGMACLVYVVQTSRKTVIRAEFSGSVAESTVRRHPRQRQYLHRVGPQTRIVKLGGYLFFGSIVKVEKRIRALIDAEAFLAAPIRYLIVDFSHVAGIDFSAAEAFSRMNRILHRREVRLVLAGVTLGSDVGRSLQMVGLFVEDPSEQAVPCPKVFEELNGALESCENEMLLVLTEKQKVGIRKGEDSPPVPIPDAQSPTSNPISAFEGVVGSPRRAHLDRAATATLQDSNDAGPSRWHALKQPLPLMLQAFQDLTDKREDFWFQATSYFMRREIMRGEMLYTRGDKPNGFYLLQNGVLKADYYLDQGNYHESIVAGTTCGELPFFSETNRTSSVLAETDCIVWLLTPEKWEELQRKDAEVAKELLKVGLKLSAERMTAITNYVLITAS